jgi:hypothetical protein
MFSKPAPKPDNRISPTPESNPLAIPAPGTEATARNRARPASILAQNLVIEGSVQSDSEVQIDGLVRGDVRVERLTIGETGRVEGQVVAETSQTLATPAEGDRPATRGLRLQPGVPRAAARWSFAQGFAGPGVSERLVVHNPGDDPAEVVERAGAHRDQGPVAGQVLLDRLV